VSWSPKHIVAAVDGSEPSQHAARQAVDIARVTGARVSMFTVVRPPEGWWGLEGSPPSPEALATALAAARSEVLDSLMADLETDGVEVTASEELGDPASVIITFCEEEGADLLVIGRRGAGLVERMMIGSVADRLAHYSPCPLMIVP
jgi:nucleotide-binding universal stress UspA family protein